ncbi:hypothetical protein CSB11_01165 [Candidatus Campbellbacteria bacterium]|nr:MAG: hypothetical protein CSB11_01165 [Candidatus Campbellbacteria bacterium]
MFGLGDKVKGMKDKAKGKVMEKMLEKQLANVPEDQKQAIMSMIEENPDFFKELGEEIQQEMANGKSQMAASMAVMRKHQAKMQELMMKNMGGNPKMSNRNLK